MSRMTIVGHLTELRRRILVALGTWMAACAVLWPFSPRLLHFLLEPLGSPAVYLGPADAFMLVVKLDLIGGAILSSPVIIWQAIAFVLPALKPSERRVAGALLAGGVVAFAVGAWFSFTFILPAMMKFLLGFTSDVLKPQIVADRYLGMVVTMAVGCGAAFELPLVTAGLARAGIMSAGWLLGHWRYAIIGCFTAGAIITPSPDAISMIMVAVPLVALYFAGVGTAALAGRGRRGR
jgi:sec-independent protein translocase protein TatC